MRPPTSDDLEACEDEPPLSLPTDSLPTYGLIPTAPSLGICPRCSPRPCWSPFSLYRASIAVRNLRCSTINLCILASVAPASPPVLRSMASRPASLRRVSRKLSKLTLLISLNSDMSSRSQ